MSTNGDEITLGESDALANFPLFKFIPKEDKWLQKFYDFLKRKDGKNGKPKIPFGLTSVNGLGDKVLHHIPPQRTFEFYKRNNMPCRFLLLPVYNKPHNKHHSIYNHRNLTESISCILEYSGYKKVIKPEILENILDVCRSNSYGLPDAQERMTFQNGELKNFLDEYKDHPISFVFIRLFEMWGDDFFFKTKPDQETRDVFLEEIQRLDEHQEEPVQGLFKLSATLPICIQN